MTFKAKAWGLGGVVSLGLTLACGATRLNDVGDVDEQGGSSGSGGGYAGSGSGYPKGGAGVAGTSSDMHGGTGGTVPSGGIAGTGGSGPGYGCFEYLIDVDSGDPLRLGPNNAVLGEVRERSGPILNYADQTVFSNAFQMDANFPSAESGVVSDDTLSFPDQLADVADNVGEIQVTRASCDGVSAAGHTLRVYAWWELNGAIGRSPTEGIALGADVDGTRIWFEDATRAFVIGEPDETRPLNTLGPIVLEHTFDEDEDVDAGQLFLSVWLLEDFIFPSTFYVQRVVWDE